MGFQEVLKDELFVKGEFVTPPTTIQDFRSRVQFDRLSIYVNLHCCISLFVALVLIFTNLRLFLLTLFVLTYYVLNRIVSHPESPSFMYSIHSIVIGFVYGYIYYTGLTLVIFQWFYITLIFTVFHLCVRKETT